MSHRPAEGSKVKIQHVTGEKPQTPALSSARPGCDPLPFSESAIKSDSAARRHGRSPTSPNSQRCAPQSKRARVESLSSKGAHSEEVVRSKLESSENDHQDICQSQTGQQEQASGNTSAQQQRSQLSLQHLPPRLGVETTAGGDEDRLPADKAALPLRQRLSGSEGKEANLRPWTGDGPEDSLSEQIIKEGYTSKLKVFNELGSAKSTLLPHLKNSEGLDHLSQLFLSAITDKRRSGAINSASTFKPPPRVTLTDARKKTWFTDLANGSVPLRRLSRSIPHGIRGKALLEQCCTYSVPTSRALWLIKCVGANELRAFKRKGISTNIANENEYRWTQEWTTCVTDFLSESLEKVNSSESLRRANQLVLCLFAEGMVHHDQFLQTICDKLENTAFEDCPVYIGLVMTYLTEMRQSFSHSHQLIKALLHHQRGLEAADPILAWIVQPLRTLLQEDDIPALLPMSSSLLEDLQPGIATSSRSRLHWKYTIGGELACLSNENNAPTRQHSCLVLDLDVCARTGRMPNMKALARGISVLDLVGILMEWSSTAFHAHKGAAYIACTILHDLVESIPDLHDRVLDSIMSLANSPRTSPARFGALAAELMSAGIFSVGTYIQTIIATGALYGADDNRHCGEAHAAILQRIPLQYLSRQLRYMRNNVLQTLQVASNQGSSEGSSSSIQLKSLSAALADMYSTEDSYMTYDLHDLRIDFDRLSQSSNRLRLEISTEAEDLCRLLNDSEDVAAVAHLLPFVIRAATYQVLAPIIQLITAFEGSLILHGTFEGLRDLAINRYRAIRMSEPSHRELITGLQGFTLKEAWQTQYLSEELRAHDQGQAMAANTPASDIVAIDSASPQCWEDSPDKAKVESPPAFTSSHTELLLASRDGADAVPASTMHACLDFLETLLGSPSTPPAQSVLTVRLVCFMLRKSGGEHRGLAQRLYRICESPKLKNIFVTAMSTNSEVAVTALVKISSQLNSTPVSRCLYSIAYGLLDPLDSSGYTAPPPACPFLDTKKDIDSFADTVEDVANNCDDLSVSVQRVGSGMLAIMQIQRTPKESAKISHAVQSRIEALVWQGNTHWAELLSLFPRSLGVIDSIREQAVEAILARVGGAAAMLEPVATDCSLQRLLDVIKEANVHSAVDVKVGGICGRILNALQSHETQASRTTEETERLQAILSLAVLHHRSFTAQTEQISLLRQLCQLVTDVTSARSEHLKDFFFAIAGFFVTKLPEGVITAIASSLPPPLLENPRIQYLLGIREDPFASLYIRSNAPTTIKDPATAATLASFNLTTDDPAETQYTFQPFEVKRWELLPDASSKDGENDTPLGLRLFGARKL